MSIEALPAGQAEALQRALATLRRGTGARCVVLAKEDGQVVAQLGTAPSVPLDRLFSTIAEQTGITAGLNHCLASAIDISLHYYEGNQQQVMAAVDGTLVLLTGQRWPSSAIPASRPASQTWNDFACMRVS